MEIKKCLLTKNDCYKKGAKMTPKGIVVHSTGANNKKISRYVQPDDGILGKNKYDNDWNRSGVTKCVHAFIGEDKNGVVRCYQTLPFDYKCWGSGSGSKGSLNGTHIQFEICEDGLKDEKYFNAAMKCAIEFCAYLCKTYKLKSSDILSHKEAHDKGMATDHGDPDYWLKKFGKSMKWFREQVEAILNPPKKPTKVIPKLAPATLKKGAKGDNVKLLQQDLNYVMGTKLAVDGSFGAGTEQAVKDYQKKYGLSVDGSYGPKSEAKMKTLLK